MDRRELEERRAQEEARSDSWLRQLADKSWSVFVVYPVLALAVFGAATLGYLFAR